VQESDAASEKSKHATGLLVLCGVGAVVLQTTILHYLPWIPDFLLVFCVYLGIYHRSIGGATGAFFLGYGLDVCSGAPVGLNAFAMSLVFAVVAATARCLWLNNPFSVVFMVLVAVMIKTGTFVCLGEFGELAMLLQPIVAHYVMWDATVAILLTPVVFTALYRGEQLHYRT
jgi:rod shape-determining protein MreD